MRKVIYPVANGGAPINGDRFGDIWLDQWTALESLLQSLVDPAATGNVGIIVSGCKITGAGPYSCSAGVVWLNGQFMAFPGFTAQTLPQYIVPASLVQISKTFASGVSNPFINQQDATFQAGVPGAGQYIALTTTGNQGNPGGMRLGGQVSPWQNITLINNWINAGTPVAKWRFTGYGQIELSLKIQSAVAANAVFANTPAAWNLAGGGNTYYVSATMLRANVYTSAIQISGSTLSIPNMNTFTLTVGDIFWCHQIFSPDNMT